MANKTTFQIIAEALGFDKTNNKVKGLTGSMRKMAAGLISVAAAYKAFGVAMDSIKLAARLEAVERGFDNLAKSAGFTGNTFKMLDDALDGTVGKLELMEAANNAMLLGVAKSDEQLAQMFDTAQRLAEALGQDAVFGINSLVTGLGRQSKLMLDNLGIMVDMDTANKNFAEATNKNVNELTEQERKQAFINEALKQGAELTASLGAETDTTARQMQRFSRNIDDFKEALGEALIESGAVQALSGLMDGITDFIDKQVRANQTLAETNGITAANAIEYNNLSEAILGAEEELDVLQRIMENVASVDDATRKTQTYVEVMEMLKESNENGVDGMDLLIDALERAQFNYDDLLLSLQNLTEADAQQVAAANAVIESSKRRADAKKKEAEAEKVLKDIREDAGKSALKMAQNQSKVADAMSQAAHKQIQDQAMLAVAKYIPDIAALLAPLGPILAPPAIAAATAGITNLITQLITNAGQGVAGAIKEEGGIIGGLPHSQGGTPIIAEAGEYVIRKDAVDSIGEGTLDAINQGGGVGTSIIINNPIISSDFVESELPELISEAIRRGRDFGMS